MQFALKLSRTVVLWDAFYCIQFSVESSSESTSRETTPESDESDEDEENEDAEEEEVAEQDDHEDQVPEFAASNGKPVEPRPKLELDKAYAKFFPEYATPNVITFS